MANNTPPIDYIVVMIDDVDLANRIVHAYDKTQVRYQISFRETPSGILLIPKQGDQWLAIRRGWIWYLQSKLDTADEHQDAVNTMLPGDMRIKGETIRIDGDVVINGQPIVEQSYARAFMLMGGG